MKCLVRNQVCVRVTSTHLSVCVCGCLGLMLSNEGPISRPTALAQCCVTVACPSLRANLVRWSGVWHMGHVGPLSELRLLMYPIISCSTRFLVWPQLTALELKLDRDTSATNDVAMFALPSPCYDCLRPGLDAGRAGWDTETVYSYFCFCNFRFFSPPTETAHRSASSCG